MGEEGLQRRGWGREVEEAVRVQTGENKDTLEEVSPGCLSCQFPLV